MFNESQIRLLKVILGCLTVMALFLVHAMRSEGLQISLQQTEIPFLEKVEQHNTEEEDKEELDNFQPLVINIADILELGLDSISTDSLTEDSTINKNAELPSQEKIALYPTPDDIVQIDPNDTTKERILLIGDSQVECVRNAIYNYTLHNNHKLVASVTWYGSVTLDWGYSDTLSHYIRKYKPTTILYVIGLNEVFVKPDENRKREFKNVINTIESHHLKYCVLGPAAWTKDYGIVEAMAEIAGKHFFDASKMTLARADDGRHPSLKGGYTWFEAAAEYMTQHLDIDFSNKITGKKFFEKDSPLFVIKNKRFKKNQKNNANTTDLANKKDTNNTDKTTEVSKASVTVPSTNTTTITITKPSINNSSSSNSTGKAPLQ